MTLPSIDLDLPRKLQDREYRKKFFIAESSAHIAKQLIELRKRRGYTQKELAELAETGQPAVSRAERADYCNWAFNTLRKLSEVMDARIRVLIEAAEDVLPEYEPVPEPDRPGASAASEAPQAQQRLPAESVAKETPSTSGVRLPKMSEHHGIGRYPEQPRDLSYPSTPTERSTLLT
jgi:transcriptional regulator with XRE-family HTH domain